ncbi:uncharacterized protein LOC129308751 [Prosopis cineraria]|uniref:uncharacterized protein LOC129308751 n=1 Tax=Prosopis cineraria TaxID=364024 RepID=UPI00240FD905|nr:uncharacterized protein LOC129308751 [Prosopis cineraria]
MADIAMLVAEEYERRIKNAKKAPAVGGGSGGSGSDERRRLEVVHSVAQGLKHMFDEEKRQFLSYNWVSEPRTQIGVAASHSFFSA